MTLVKANRNESGRLHKGELESLIRDQQRKDAIEHEISISSPASSYVEDDEDMIEDSSFENHGHHPPSLAEIDE